MYVNSIFYKSECLCVRIVLRFVCVYFLCLYIFCFSIYYIVSQFSLLVTD